MKLKAFMIPRLKCKKPCSVDLMLNLLYHMLGFPNSWQANTFSLCNLLKLIVIYFLRVTKIDICFLYVQASSGQELL